MTLALVLILVGPISTRADLDFMRAQEESVMAMLPHPIRLDAGMPAHVAELIRLLGDPCHRCRERAQTELEALSRDDPRWLFWGIRARDLEIRRRCGSVLSRCGPVCWRCRGAGRCAGELFGGSMRWCPICDGYHPTDRQRTEGGLCATCAGTGRSWLTYQIEEQED